MRDALDDFKDYDRDYNDETGIPRCVICDEPIWDAEYIEYDQKCCHCDDDCSFDFFKEHMAKDFTYRRE